MTDLAPIFNRAADLIERDGLAKAVFKTDAGCRCAVGALADAVDVDPLLLEIRYPEIMRGFLRAVALPENDRNGDPDSCAIFDWNDRPSTKKSHVVDALRKAASLAREPAGGPA